MRSLSCNCKDFPAIKYCKHLCAAQEAFEDDGGLTLEDTNTDTQLSVSPGLQGCVPMESVGESASSEPINSEDQRRVSAALSTLITSVKQLYRRSMQADISLDEEKVKEIEDFVSSIKQYVAYDPRSGNRLPAAQKIAPNRKTKHETAEAYGRKAVPSLKTRKRQHTDTFSAGEQSGKLAKPDAKINKHAKTQSSIAQSAPATSSTPLSRLLPQPC